MPRKKEAWLKASAPLGAHQDVPQPSGRVAMLSRVLRVTETYLPTVRLLQSVRLLTASPASWLSSQEGQRPTVRGSGSRKSRPIWEGYKRNFKGSIPPKRTRLRCKRGTKLCGNPCPICRNEIRIIYTDHQLLEQFICPHTGEVLDTSKTGLCQQQQKRLIAEVEKAWEHGALPYPIPRELPEDVYKIPPWNQINIKR